MDESDVSISRYVCNRGHRLQRKEVRWRVPCRGEGKQIDVCRQGGKWIQRSAGQTTSRASQRAANQKAANASQPNVLPQSDMAQAGLIGRCAISGVDGVGTPAAYLIQRAAPTPC